MSLLKKIFFLLLLAGFYSPAFAAVNGFEPGFCSVYSEGDKGGDNGGDKKEEGEEEPDCE